MNVGDEYGVPRMWRDGDVLAGANGTVGRRYVEAVRGAREMRRWEAERREATCLGGDTCLLGSSDENGRRHRAHRSELTDGIPATWITR